MAPPWPRVPALMDDLFGWLNDTEAPMLVKSCVFHYEKDMEAKHTYDVILHHEDGVYWGEVPSLPGCYAEGDTKAEVLADVREAILFHLRGLSEMAVPSDAELVQVGV